MKFRFLRRIGFGISFTMLSVMLLCAPSEARAMPGPDRGPTAESVVAPCENLSDAYVGALFCTSAKGAFACGAIVLGYNLHDAVAAARAALLKTAGGGSMVSAVSVIHDRQVICGVGLTSDPPCED